MPIVNRVADLQPDIQAWRRDIHAHPELLYDVHRTAAFVADRLREFGCDEVATGLGKTGVVGVIKGKKLAGNGDIKVIGLRADMDALPIEEATGLPYASKTSGKMHACGHDGHTAMLLGAARYLAETRNFAGDAVVIFQPAEEGGAGAEATYPAGSSNNSQSAGPWSCSRDCCFSTSRPRVSNRPSSKRLVARSRICAASGKWRSCWSSNISTSHVNSAIISRSWIVAPLPSRVTAPAWMRRRSGALWRCNCCSGLRAFGNGRRIEVAKRAKRGIDRGQRSGGTG